MYSSAMHTEIEAKWLDVDHNDLRLKLKNIGAELVHSERLMARKIYDFPNAQLKKVGGWARVRDEGDRVTMRYKQQDDKSLHGTKEVNLTVDSFDEADSFLLALGLVCKSTQETKRESWKLGDVEIELDTWPWIPPYVEIEAPSESELTKTAKALGLTYEEGLPGAVSVAYRAVYELVPGEVDSWESITFTPIPEWLEAKIKK